jgi:phosphate-selective porin OprO and OprP
MTRPMNGPLACVAALCGAAWAETAEPAKPAGEPVRLAYDKGVTMSSADERFELKLIVRGQFRLEVVHPEADDEFESHFVVPRLRFQLEGHALGEENLYKVEFDMANKGSAVLKDYFVEHAFVPAFRLRVGQWKLPFMRQVIVSDFATEFLERSLVDDKSPGFGFVESTRDLGVAVHNGYDKSPDGLEWVVGVFNATGDKPTQTLTCTDPADATTCTVAAPTNVRRDFGPLVVARAAWNWGGIKGYSEGDLEGGPPRFAVGAAYKVNLNNLEQGKQDAVEIDTLIKLYGYDLSGAFFVSKKGDMDRIYGFYVQPGYFVLPKLLELAFRFTQIHDEANAGEHVHEVLGAIDWYFSGHAFKWMTDGGLVHHTFGDVSDWQFRTQLQFVF